MRQLVHALAFMLLSAPALAQTSPGAVPLSRADVAATLGWFNADKSDLPGDSYRGWYRRSLHGGLTAGWYWTDHLKTELDVGATTRATVYRYPRVILDGRTVNTPVEYSFSTRKLAIAQVYQAFRNQWVHPYTGVGVEVTWERVTERHGPTYVYDQATYTPLQVLVPRTIGPRTDTIVRPFGAVGFKAYVTPRGFLKSELRMAFRGGIDEVLLRLGFGIDF